MYKKNFLAAIYILFSLVSFGQNKNNLKEYRFTIDLINVNKDRVKVELKTPLVQKKIITYHLPKIVPGTYAIYNFGRFVDQFRAFDKKGDTLMVTRNDENSWTVSNADKLVSITYYVNDTYDDTLSKPLIFEPAGSDILKDTVFVINNHCFLGYFDNLKNIPYELTILHPSNLYGSTALIDKDKSLKTDRFITESYNQMVDNPILYDIPDTSSIKVGNSVVLISVYSPNKLVKSEFLAKKLDTLLKAQTKYLGGKLPVNKYAFVIFLDNKTGNSGMEGALEHSYSSFYYYGERDSTQLSEIFVDNAAHEFFHIITPLSIHSEEIQNFDFDDPKMSEHLWLYEGSTEYHAHMVQEKYGLISPLQLLNSFSKMITSSKTRFNDTLSFTAMSLGVLGKYKNQYENVYQKGALIALCIDVKLLQLSNGKYGFMNLIRDLSMKYGTHRGFKDSELFDEIGKITYPEIKDFLKKYVSGSRALPLDQIFNSLGISLQPRVETKDSIYSMGRLRYDPEKQRLVVTDITNMNVFGKNLGYQIEDEIISINGIEMNPANIGNFFRKFQSATKIGDVITVQVIRKDENGAEKIVELKAPMVKSPVIKYNVLQFSESALPLQLKLRDFWLKPNGIQIN